MISEEYKWDEVLKIVEKKLDKWQLFDDSRIINTLKFEEEHDEMNYTTRIPIINELDTTQLEILETLTKDPNKDLQKTPYFKITNRKKLWLMIY